MVINPYAFATGGGSTLLTGLFDYWDLTSASGNETGQHASNVLTDNGGVGYNATGGPDGGPCRVFDGTDDFLQGGDYAFFNSGDWTIAGWFYGTAGDCYLYKGGTWPAYTLLLYDESTGGFQFWTNGGSNNNTQIAAVRGSWFFIKLDYNATTTVARISTNAGTHGSRTVTGTLNDVANPLLIGADGASALPFLQGRANKLGMWSRLLDDAEATTLYNSGAGLNYADL